MKRTFYLLLIVVMTTLGALALSGCGGSGDDAASGGAEAAGLEDGTYVVDFVSDHNMFHVNDYNNDKGILTVKGGEMTVHVSLQSKKIVNLFYGNKEDAQKEGAEMLPRTVDTIDYGDGYTEEVYGFDVPVPALDEPFEVSIIGTHGNWYTHNVTVSNPVPGDDIHAGTEIDLEDGEYQVDVAKEGGTGRADIDSPTTMTVKNGEAIMTVTWSSENYDYMIVDEEKYEPVNESGNSVFEIPVSKLNEPMKVIADTTAMSEPHEIEYELTVTLVEE
ncbi:MAG: iron transporter [Firmicutes bacterium]|nr:iron transporter [Bacillota bacterium]